MYDNVGVCQELLATVFGSSEVHKSPSVARPVSRAAPEAAEPEARFILTLDTSLTTLTIEPGTKRSGF